MQNFKDLQVWSKARRLVLCVYCRTKDFPKQERYGLVSQMRRCSVSIPSNIAEGRESRKQLHRFLEIAMGSACELECQLLLAHDLGYLNEQAFVKLEADTVEIKRMLTGLMKRVRP